MLQQIPKFPEITNRRNVPSSSASRGNPRIGPAGPLEVLDRNVFKLENYHYPLDIESQSHVMLFNINAQSISPDIKKVGINEGINKGQSRSQQLRNVPGNILGASGSSITNSEFGANASDLLGSVVGQDTTKEILNGIDSVTLNRKTKRLKTSIALYVPETLIYNDTGHYETPSMLETLGPPGLALAAGASTGQPGYGVIAALALSAAGGVVDKAAKSLTSPSGKLNTLSRATLGFGLNPIIEVLYVAPELRQFSFDFLFTPRSKKEADQIWQIVYQFRRHQAPEFKNLGPVQGAFFIPPSEFDITFLRKSEYDGSLIQNTNIPSISTCVCTSCSVDYSPENIFSTHNDGFPVSLRLQLNFRELDIMTRERIDMGF